MNEIVHTLHNLQNIFLHGSVQMSYVNLTVFVIFVSLIFMYIVFFLRRFCNKILKENREYKELIEIEQNLNKVLNDKITIILQEKEELRIEKLDVSKSEKTLRQQLKKLKEQSEFRYASMVKEKEDYQKKYVEYVQKSKLLESDRDNMSNSIKKKNEENKQISYSLQKIQDEMQLLEKSKKCLQTQLDKAIKSISKLTLEKSDLKNKSVEIEQKLIESENTIRCLQTSIEQKNRIQTDLSSDLSLAQEHLKASEKEIMNINQKLQKKDVSLSEQKELIASLRKEIKKGSEEIDKLKQEKRKAENELKTKISEQNALSTQKSSVKSLNPFERLAGW